MAHQIFFSLFVLIPHPVVHFLVGFLRFVTLLQFSFFASDYNYDDPGDIQRKLERLNKIMNQPDWNPNDPNKKMYLSQCKCTYATRPFVFIVPFSRSVRLFAIDFPSMTFEVSIEAQVRTNVDKAGQTFSQVPNINSNNLFSKRCANIELEIEKCSFILRGAPKSSESI